MALLELCVALVLLLGAVVWKFFARDHIYKAFLLEVKLRRQGLAGPPRSILHGNLGEMMRMRAQTESKNMQTITHDIVEFVQPHVVHWTKTYGTPCVAWWSSEPRVVITDLDMIKDVLFNRSGVFCRSALQQKFLIDVIGRGLVVVNGDEWAFRRHIMSPAFYQEKIKGMVGTMVRCVSEMVRSWEKLTESEAGQVEVEVSVPITELTADVISRTAFGSSYKNGHKAYELVQKLIGFVIQRFTSPWSESFIPISKINRRIRATHRELNSMLEEIIQAKREKKLTGETTTGYGNDLLGLMLEEVDRSHAGGHNGLVFTNESLVEECKTFYVAGHETTAKLITWAILLLAINPSWQDRARAEVQETCGSNEPDADAVSKLKSMGMILNETLRLYPPAVFVVRNAFQDTRLGNINVPAGTGVFIPILSLLHDKDVWGADADEFKPERFVDGVASASKHPFAFLPFSQGPRVCIGQGFALTEAKVALAMILQRFQFEISPAYQHAPVLGFTLRPKNGLQVLLRRL